MIWLTYRHTTWSAWGARDWDFSTRLYAKDISDVTNDAPDRHDNEQGDNAPEHPSFALFVSFTSRSADKLDDSPDKIDQGKSNKYRDEHINDSGYELFKLRNIATHCLTGLDFLNYLRLFSMSAITFTIPKAPRMTAKPMTP